MTMPALKVAVAQMCSGTEPGPNLDALDALVAQAAEGGAAYVLTPEMSVVFAENRDNLRAVAEPFAGNSAVARLSDMARRHAIHLHLGSMPIALPDGHFANRSLLFSPDGTLAASYDKIHLFDAEPEGDKAYRESATYAGGGEAVVTDAPRFRLGMSICYDVRFPALYRALAEAGAEVVSVPAAFTVPTGKAHWEILLRARAIETGCFVLAAAQGGAHQNGRSTWGHSMVVSPWGEVLAEKADDTPGVIFAELDLDRVARARRQVPALANARGFALPEALAAAQ